MRVIGRRGYGMYECGIGSYSVYGTKLEVVYCSVYINVFTGLSFNYRFNQSSLCLFVCDLSTTLWSNLYKYMYQDVGIVWCPILFNLEQNCIFWRYQFRIICILFDGMKQSILKQDK